MRVSGTHVGGEETSWTAEVRGFEGGCEEEDDGEDVGGVGFWKGRAGGLPRLCVPVGARRGGGKGGAPLLKVCYPIGSHRWIYLGLWLGSMAVGLALLTAPRGCGAGLITQACDTCAAHFV